MNDPSVQVIEIERTDEPVFQDPAVAALDAMVPGLGVAVNRATVMIRAGGITVPAKTEKRCHVCQSIYRDQIEARLLQGIGVKSIIAELPDTIPVPISEIGIRRHRKRHMSDAAIMAAIENAAILMGNSVEDATAGLITPLAFTSVVLQKAMFAMTSKGGDYMPDIQEGLSAARLQNQITGGLPAEVDDRYSVEEVAQHLAKHLQAHCSPEILNRLTDAFAHDPVLAPHLVGPTPEEDAIEDAQVVEDEVVIAAPVPDTDDDEPEIQVEAEADDDEEEPGTEVAVLRPPSRPQIGLKEIMAHRASQGNLTDDEMPVED